MGYAAGHPVHLVGGRLALDFVNTADWSPADEVAHEKLETRDDVIVWAEALALGEAALPRVAELRALRATLRAALTGRGGLDVLDGLAPTPTRAHDAVAAARCQPLVTLLVASALALLADQRELDRLKRCPGHDCGWLFIDETRNSRRKWCRMESCGNRAKAARHYRRTRRGALT